MKYILLIPALLYIFTISWFILPLVYGKRKWGVLGFVSCWFLYLLLIPLMFIKSVENFGQKCNRAANWCMGYSFDSTVSSQLGKRIDAGIATSIEIAHCKLLATYDPAGSHCSKNCKGFFWRRI